MNAERLLALYERVAEAPDAIARLRRFILDLAVRGKLVPQDPQDEPASELLKRIAKEKARLVKAGEIRRQPTLESITDSASMHPLPRTWAWVRVGDIFDYDAGTKRDPKELDPARWLLELEDIEKDTSRISQRFRVNDRDSLSTKSEFEPDDILYGKLRPYLNKVVVADEPGYSTTEIVAIRPFLKLSSEYCALAFRRPDFVTYVERLGRGTKMPRLRTPDAIIAPFPLPPLAEQHRIVAKVDELMALCDQLEAARQEREARRDRLAAASLARLNAPDPETFQSDARFTLNALPALTTRPNQIKQLRQTILNLAVRGKLVPQDPNDEPAATLSERLAKKFAKEPIGIGRGRRSEIVAGLIEKAPYLVPSGWLWVRMGDLGETNIGLTYSPVEISSAGIPVLRSNNIQAGKIHLSDLVRVTSKPKPSAMVSEGDLLICARNGSRSLVGKAAIIERLSEPMAFGAFMAIFRSPVNRYLHLFLSSPVFRQVIDEVNTNTINQITQANLRSTLIPLPPLAEQHRIVAKVDELMALCDQLEAARQEREARRDRLAAASLARLNAPDPETFQSDARFTLNALPALTTRPNQIKQLRQTILNLAVRGKLVPQDPNDEPAATLSERLAKKFAKEPIGIGRGRRSEIVAGLIEKAPYLVPSGWLWVRMGDLGETNIGLTYSPVEISSAGIPVLRSNNIQAGKIHLSDLVRVTSKPKPSAMVSEGDLLICARNGSRSLVGKAAIIERLSEPMAFGAFMAIFRSPVNRYLHLFLSSPVFRQVIDEVNTNTINQITQANLRSTLIPLPPLAEQHRIVAKVDELMALCDRLEASLTTSNQTRTRLLEATLTEALAPAGDFSNESIQATGKVFRA